MDLFLPSFQSIYKTFYKPVLAIGLSFFLSGYISISSPRTYTVVRGIITVTVTVNPPDRFYNDQVALYVDRVRYSVDRGAPYTFRWDTRSVPNGRHILYVRAYSLITRQYVYSPAILVYVRNAVVVDATAPSVTIVAPSSGAVVSASATVNATATDNVGVSGVQFLLDGIHLGAEDTAGPYTLTWNTSSIASGGHSLSARARDAAGNTTTSAAVAINVDNAAPTVSLSANPAGPTYTTAQMITLTAAAADNAGVTRVEFYDGATLRSTATTSPYTYGWNITSADNGAHSWSTRAYDTANNNAASSPLALTVAIDMTAPSAPTGVTLGNPTSASLEANWSASTDDVAVTGYRLDVSTTGTFSSFVTGYNNLDVGHTSLRNITGLSPNTTYYVRIRAYDAAGNSSANSATATGITQASPDTAAPAVTLTAPAVGAALSASVIVSATASDNGGVMGVQFLLDGANLGSEDATAPYTLTWNTTAATNGTHALAARARDAAGNTTTSAAVAINVDNAAPTVSLSANPAGPTYTTAQMITLTAAAADNAGVTRVEFYDGTTLRSTATTSPHTYSFTVSATDNGSHAWTARVYDAAGNTTTSSALALTVSIDATPPTVSLTAPISGAVVSGNSVMIGANASDNVGVAGVQFLLDGTNVGSQDINAPYTLTWNTTTVADGSHTLQAMAVDQAGNSASTAPTTVTVNNAPLPPPPPPTGSQLFVDGACATSGNGSSLTCGSSGPFRTIGEGILAMQPGYTLNIRGAHAAFDGVYFEQLSLRNGAPPGVPGKALACTSTSPCVIQGCRAPVCPANEQPTIRGMIRRGDWTALGGVYSRVMEATPEPDGQGRSALGPDYDPYVLLQDEGTVPITPLAYAGDNVTSPADGQWSFNPTTNVATVNPIGTANPATAIYVPHFAYNVKLLAPTAYTTLRYLTFEGTRGRSFSLGTSGSAMPAGNAFTHNILRYTVRHFMLVQNLPGVAITDNLIEVGCRGWSFANPQSDGCYGIRMFNVPGAVISRNTIRQLGATGRFRLTGAAGYTCPWCPAPWNDPTHTQWSAHGTGINLKQTTVATIQDNIISDLLENGIALDVSHSVTVQGNDVRRMLSGIGMLDFTPVSAPAPHLYNSGHVISRNIVDEAGYQNMDGACAVSLSGGANRDPGAPVQLVTFTNNVISHCGFACLCLRNDPNRNPAPMTDVLIAHNTLYGARSVSGSAPARGLIVRDATQNVSIRNNIFDGFLSATSSDGLVITTAAAGGLSLDGDVIGTVAGCQVRWNVPAFSATPNGGTCDTLAAHEVNGRTGALHFANVTAVPPDLHLTTGSVAIDIRVDMPDLAIDFDGDLRPQGAGWDAGADEWIR